MHFKQEKGSVTVEASIALTAFLFFFVTLFTIINVCYAQSKIAVAINNTAKEISQYSYLYSLTGLNGEEAKLAEEASGTAQNINDFAGNMNNVFNAIQGVGETGKTTDISDVTSILSAYKAIGDDVKSAGASIGAIKNQIEDLAKDPKTFILGVTKLFASESLDVAKSRLIAAPLSKAMVQKHLKSSKEEDPNKFLKKLGIVPNMGSSQPYVDGLNFDQSLIFPKGTDEITIIVTYKVKIIQLLPINIELTFTQTASTRCWFTEYKSISQKAEDEVCAYNDTLWTTAPVNERASLIRNITIKELASEGYSQVRGFTSVQMIEKSKNEFVLISSSNLLYDLDYGTLPSDADISKSINGLVGSIKSDTNKVSQVKLKDNSVVDVSTNKKNKVVLIIPNDSGLKETYENVIAGMDTQGVTIEIRTGFGSGYKETPIQNN